MDGSEDRGFADRVRQAYRETPAAEEAERERLMGALRAGRAPRRRRGGALGWLTGPVVLEVRPLAALAAAIVLVALGVWAGLALQRARTASETASPGIASGAPAGRAGPARVVRFEISTPGASTVALVGDFNGWDPRATPMRRLRAGSGQGDTWVVSIPVPRGRHVYAFVVDGERWTVDPRAPLAPEDDFGKQNSVIVVGGPASS